MANGFDPFSDTATFSDPFSTDAGTIGSTSDGSGSLLSDFSSVFDSGLTGLSNVSPTFHQALNPSLQPVQFAGAGQMIVRGAGALAARFPNLAGAILQIGRGATPQRLLELLRKFGPGVLTGMIGAAAVNELVTWHMSHKRRHMNSLNPKALRRSVRRLTSFERKAANVTRALSCMAPMRHRRKSRCFKCHRSPCVCS